MSKYDNRNKAVALKYDTDNDVAPVIIASGYGEIANKIIEIAEHNGIPVYRDDSASSLMCMLDVGETVRFLQSGIYHEPCCNEKRTYKSIR